jgi:hypothetical protein
MKTLLMITTRDPSRDPKVAEMVRIAAGLGSWGQVKVDIALFGPAIRAIDRYPEELMDGHLIAAHLAAIPEHGGEIWVEEKALQSAEFDPTVVFRASSRADILARPYTCSMTF